MMVRALHAAGIEVILDVVYNHTAEGNHLGPDAVAARHRQRVLLPAAAGRPAPLQDFTGCGNTLNMRHPRVLQLIMDSLRYWVVEMHVDGFRFDLASALARELYDVDKLGSFFDIIHQDPVLSQVKLIAEPWDLGEGGYQVGNFPAGWTEWNGRYRDACAASGAATAGRCRELASRLAGSSDLYAQGGRRPYASINFVTCPRRLHAARPRHLQRQAQRGQRRGQPRRRAATTSAGTAASKGQTDDPAIIGAARAPEAQLPGDAAAVAGRADAARPATSSAAPSAATTTPTARTTRSAGSTGT